MALNPKSKRTHIPAFKAAIVLEILQGRSYGLTAKSHGLSKPTIYGWASKARSVIPGLSESTPIADIEAALTFQSRVSTDRSSCPKCGGVLYQHTATRSGTPRLRCKGCKFMFEEVDL